MQAIDNNKYKAIVTEQGIEIEGSWYTSPKLLPLVGETVIACLSKVDKRQAFIFTAKSESYVCGSYVCCAESQQVSIHPQSSKRKSYIVVAEVLHLHHPETVMTLRAAIDSVVQRDELQATREEAELVVAELIEELIFIKTETLAAKLASIRGGAMSKPLTTFLRVWDYIRVAKEFSCLDLCALGISRNHAYWYINKMRKHGYITLKKERKVRGEYGKYLLAADAPILAPIFSKTERKNTRHPRQKVWTAMRIFGKFTVNDLQIASESSYSVCHRYIRALVKAGYVKLVCTRGRFGGKQYTYQLVQNTGPMALKICRDGIVDPNTKKTYEIGKAA